MDFEWVAIALGDVAWISLAFVLGFGARMIGLPPLVGFLATGFALNYMGFASGEMLQKLADLGVTLLLFIVGLKLDPKMLLRPHVWAVTGLHIGVVVTLFGLSVFALATLGVPLFTGLDFGLAMMLGFALSFSSTVFVVKALEDRGDMGALHGRVAVSILVMQDIAAVAFLAASTGKLPAWWALVLLLLIPLRPAFHFILQRTGHGELLILYGLVLALGGAELFELGGVKDDLGALVLGVLVSGHPKAVEMAKTMLGFKDVFLVGFFLSIGMTGTLTPQALLVAIVLVPFITVKSALFFALLTRFRLRARTSLMAALKLGNYSEFGLIVVAIGVTSGWIDAQWLTVIALALSLSFVVSAPLAAADDRIYARYRESWLEFERDERIAEDQQPDVRDARIAIFGMGRVGTGAYDTMRELHGDDLVGVDSDAGRVRRHRDAGRNVIRGAPTDADFWETIGKGHRIDLVMLALPNVSANLDALRRLHEIGFDGHIAATARYPDDDLALRRAGATSVFNVFAEAGAGFAAHTLAGTVLSRDVYDDQAGPAAR